MTTMGRVVPVAMGSPEEVGRLKRSSMSRVSTVPAGSIDWLLK